MDAAHGVGEEGPRGGGPVRDLRGDRAAEEGVEGARDSPEEPGDDEGRELVAADRDPVELCALGIVANGLQGDAEGRGLDARQQPQASYDHTKHEDEIMARIRQPAAGVDAADPVVPARHIIPFVDDGEDELAEGQAQHQESGLLPAMAVNDQHPEQEGAQRGDQRSRHHGGLHAPGPARHEQAGGIGRQRLVGGMAEGQHAAIAHQPIEAAGEKNGDENLGAQIDEADRRREPHGEERGDGDKRQRNGRPVGLVLQHDPGRSAQGAPDGLARIDTL